MSSTHIPERTFISNGGIIDTISCLLMFPTLVSDTKNFWKEANGGNLRTTFLGVVICQASLFGNHEIGSGGVTGSLLNFNLLISGI